MRGESFKTIKINGFVKLDGQGRMSRNRQPASGTAEIGSCANHDECADLPIMDCDSPGNSAITIDSFYEGDNHSCLSPC
jgi:hypothetical protein